MIMAKKAKKSGAKKSGDAKVPLHVVVHFVQMLRNRKHAAKFIAHAKKSKASIKVAPKDVKVINSFLAVHKLQATRTARGLELCPGGDPWKCQD
jgi:hypothetical protein